MGNLRVIAGSARGRRLKLVAGKDTRPISDRVKEALFNIIGRDIEGATILDLFGGTGGVGIEGLSRGAAKAVFVDTSSRAIRTMRENLTITGSGERAQIIQTDALVYLRRAFHGSFGFIYIAPPQYCGLWSAALKTLDVHQRWLDPDGWAIVQINPVEFAELDLDNLTLFDQRRYGNTMLCFYERSDG